MATQVPSSLANDPNNKFKHFLFTTLTLNSFTLFAYENVKFKKSIYNNLNFNPFEIISDQIPPINNSNSLYLGIIPLNSLKNLSPSEKACLNICKLSLYYIKFNSHLNNDLITIITLCPTILNKKIPFKLMDNILNEFKKFKDNIDSNINGNTTNTNNLDKKNNNNNKNLNISTNTNNINITNDYGSTSSPQNTSPKDTSYLSEFKKIFDNLILKEEEKLLSQPSNLILTELVYPDPSIASSSNNNTNNPAKTTQNYDPLSVADLDIEFATQELNNIKKIMNENINKIIERDERIGLLVNKTDKLNFNSNTFKKRTTHLKRKIWLNDLKFRLIVAFIALFFLYLFIGDFCGLPLYGKCFPRHSNDGDNK
ncbi:synaptobrevin family protein [Ascoidea rubescens DSM 1968]|uniref:Synaptobrevin-domain-containing protein n=1 Tax=Ascoidea rubescens DSM 1968 TaxID=1344418 RepID=A0A1D2VPF6_9ASCO|nr:synaptobrevin-domain-containing protein [Ascoidea rubescens DSM 1968]ODV63486.1 synaptobrevin-domain-containing protein [Ascoidea rubescens DSM 1968]